MVNSDLNSIIALHNNNPEVFNKEYYIVERGLDDRIKNVHAYSKEKWFELIGVADGKIFMIKGLSYLNYVIDTNICFDTDLVTDFLESYCEANNQGFNVVNVSKFELLDLSKVY